MTDPRSKAEQELRAAIADTERGMRWGHGQQERITAAIKALQSATPANARAMAEKWEHRELLKDYEDLQRLYGAAVIRLHELGKESTAATLPDAPQPATARSEPVAWRVWARGHKFTRGIYENPSQESFDIWEADGDEAEPLYAAPLSETQRRDGHSALRVRDGKLETFDPHPETAPSGMAKVPVEIDRAKHGNVLLVWNDCMIQHETLEMTWPKLVAAMLYSGNEESK